jgi:PPOX class probable F420-dependent enzyme
MVDLPEDVRALFEGANIGHVATTLPDGSPHSVPVWVGIEGDRVAFLTGPGSRKARNLDRDPRLAISITARDQPFVMAQVRGHIAERLEGDAAWEVIDRLSHKYIGAPYPVREDRVVFLVEPDRAWGQAFG